MIKYSIYFLTFFSLSIAINAQGIRTMNATKYGATGNDNSDDTKAIQRCIDELSENGGGTVYLPEGTYIISNQHVVGKAICLAGKNNVDLKGEDKNTILKLADMQPNFSRILSLIDVKKIKIYNLTFDGNYMGQFNPSKPNEHMGGIFMDEVDSVEIKNCNFLNTGGDGLGFRGIKKPSMHVYVHQCFFDNNQRNGLTMGSGYRYIHIEKCTFGEKIKNSPIDSEPSSGYCGDVLIEDNDLINDNLFTVGGYRDSMASNIVIRNNRLKGSFFIIYGRNVLIENNTIDNFQRRPAVTVLRENHDVRIMNNKITVNNNSAFYIVYTAKMFPENIRIEGNTILFNSDKDRVFNIKGADGLIIKSNIIKNNNLGKLLVDLSGTRSMVGFDFSNNTAGKFEKNFSFRFLKDKKLKNCIITNNKLGNKEDILPASMNKFFENLKIKNNK